MLVQMPLFHFLVAEYYPSVYRYHIFFIHASINGHLGCICVLALCNGLLCEIFKVEFFYYLDTCSGMGLLAHTVALFLIFKGKSIFFSKVAAPT